MGKILKKKIGSKKVEKKKKKTLESVISSIKDEFDKLASSIEEDVTKFDEDGNKAAGARVRAALLEFKKNFTDLYMTAKNTSLGR